ncbi:hypothetical protein LNQ81_08780 [Myroides sp. M-43]|uniref:hypothetical protein n=1 Tax=Myroides oncorhynchi TaxID=2893756 RepID=UPI001E4642A7|nr:hypothetical protein [Myroides oncorhynchi]MCC9042777.1 hypothetical protein [Myroides oncorhynchi]
MKKIFSLMIFGLIGVSSFAQDTLRLKFLNNESLTSEQQFLGKDIYDSTYIKEEDIFKKNTKYSGVQYKSKQLDSLTSIDITNPLELMLFYKEKKAIVIVNRELAERSIIELGVKFPSMEVSYAGVSTKRNYWLVNERNKSVNLYNSVTYELHRVFSIPLESKVKQYYTLPHLFFWIDTDNVLHGYNLSGSNILTHKLASDYDLMQILEQDKLLYSYKDVLYFIDLKASKSFVVSTKEKSISAFFYSNQKLSIFDGQKLNNYFIKLP